MNIYLASPNWTNLFTFSRCLSEKLERTKKKYENRLKKMEQQILQSMLFPTQFSAAAVASGGIQQVFSFKSFSAQ